MSILRGRRGLGLLSSVVFALAGMSFPASGLRRANGPEPEDPEARARRNKSALTLAKEKRERRAAKREENDHRATEGKPRGIFPNWKASADGRRVKLRQTRGMELFKVSCTIIKTRRGRWQYWVVGGGLMVGNARSLCEAKKACELSVVRMGVSR